MNRIYFKPVDDGVDSIDDVDIRVYLPNLPVHQVH